MIDYRVRLAPLGRRAATWTLSVCVSAKSRTAARQAALQKARKYLADRDVRIVRVQEC